MNWTSASEVLLTEHSRECYATVHTDDVTPASSPRVFPRARVCVGDADFSWLRQWEAPSEDQRERKMKSTPVTKIPFLSKCQIYLEPVSLSDSTASTPDQRALKVQVAPGSRIPRPSSLSASAWVTAELSPSPEMLHQPCGSPVPHVYKQSLSNKAPFNYPVSRVPSVFH